jgi:diguanylate cyclase (GGDEF)-like protein
VVAERIRDQVERGTAHEDTGMPGVTVSVGIAQLKRKIVNAGAFVRAADAALYKAKHSGKNTVVVGD